MISPVNLLDIIRKKKDERNNRNVLSNKSYPSILNDNACTLVDRDYWTVSLESPLQCVGIRRWCMEGFC